MEIAPEDHVILEFMKSKYLNTLETLLSNSDILTSYGHRLAEDFRHRHGTGSFLCRFPRCERAVQGFGDTESREAHERCHVVTYKCTEPRCPQEGWVFPNRRALNLHRKNVHNAVIPLPIVQSFNLPSNQSSIRKLEEIEDLQNLYRVYGHDWPRIARAISTTSDPKEAKEVSQPNF